MIFWCCLQICCCPLHACAIIAWMKWLLLASLVIVLCTLAHLWICRMKSIWFVVFIYVCWFLVPLLSILSYCMVIGGPNMSGETYHFICQLILTSYHDKGPKVTSSKIGVKYIGSYKVTTYNTHSSPNCPHFYWTTLYM